MTSRWIAVLFFAAACTGDIDQATDAGGSAGEDGRPAPSADGSATDPDAAPVSNDEPAGLTGITALHNEVRATVGVGPMTWDPALAAIAQAWAEQCIDEQAPAGLVDHNAGRSDTYPGYVGENVYGSGGSATPAGAVNRWADEAANYDYASNTCATNKVCGHYTQIVWRDSVKLGCGLHNCSGLQYGGTLVCNYAPGGNSGGSPY